MKTKEIDVWISESIAKYPHGHRFESLYLGTTAPHGYGYKAKLIIELPEQKIEITESDLISAYKKSMDAYENYPLLSKMLKELGFTE